eukprot:Em0001g442a
MSRIEFGDGSNYSRKKMEEDARTEQKEKQSGARPKPVVEQGDKDVAKENGVQLKSRLDNAAVLHEAERLETHAESEGVKFFKEVHEIQRLQREDPTLQPLWKARQKENRRR